MRRARLPAVAGISFAATAAAILVPSAAFAAVASASPNQVARGGQATFRINCSGHATSAHLAGDSLGLRDDMVMDTTSAGRFALTVRVPDSLPPGPHDVDIVCSDGTAGTVRIQVAPRAGTETHGEPASGAAMTAAVLGGGAVALAAVGGAIVLGRRQDLDSAG